MCGCVYVWLCVFVYVCVCVCVYVCVSVCMWVYSVVVSVSACVISRCVYVLCGVCPDV